MNFYLNHLTVLVKVLFGVNLLQSIDVIPDRKVASIT